MESCTVVPQSWSPRQQIPLLYSPPAAGREEQIQGKKSLQILLDLELKFAAL